MIAVVNDTYANASQQHIRGIDASYRQRFELKRGYIDAYGNATWLALHQQTIVTAPDVELSGTIFSAPKFKARAGATWTSDPWSLTGIVNYIASETDTVIVPAARIPAWTTLDTNLAYRWPTEGGGVFAGVTISLAASNLFDKRPPYTPTPVANTSPHFDSTNTSIVGRFLRLTVSKSW